jgi:hypothetical protein
MTGGCETLVFIIAHPLSIPVHFPLPLKFGVVATEDGTFLLASPHMSDGRI